MKKAILLLYITIYAAGCRFSVSTEKDLISGLTSTGTDISCGTIYLKSGGEKTARNSFVYGETFSVCFDDIKGLTAENGNVFPGMSLTVADMSGDTVLFVEDLYKDYSEGINFSPLQLTADLTVADPIRSGKEYSLSLDIRDKKGSGRFTSEMDFKVTRNEMLEVVTESVTYNEVYLFSQAKNQVITDNIIGFDDNIYLIVEGTKGFTSEQGNVFPGLKLNVSDADGNTILDYDDLFAEYAETGIAESDFSSRVSSHFRITGTSSSNPLHCEMQVWDKKSKARLEIKTDLTIK